MGRKRTRIGGVKSRERDGVCEVLLNNQILVSNFIVHLYPMKGLFLSLDHGMLLHLHVCLAVFLFACPSDLCLSDICMHFYLCSCLTSHHCHTHHYTPFFIHEKFARPSFRNIDFNTKNRFHSLKNDKDLIKNYNVLYIIKVRETD